MKLQRTVEGYLTDNVFQNLFSKLNSSVGHIRANVAATIGKLLLYCSEKMKDFILPRLTQFCEVLKAENLGMEDLVPVYQGIDKFLEVCPQVVQQNSSDILSLFLAGDLSDEEAREIVSSMLSKHQFPPSKFLDQLNTQLS